MSQKKKMKAFEVHLLAPPGHGKTLCLAALHELLFPGPDAAYHREADVPDSDQLEWIGTTRGLTRQIERLRCKLLPTKTPPEAEPDDEERFTFNCSDGHVECIAHPGERLRTNNGVKPTLLQESFFEGNNKLVVVPLNPFRVALEPALRGVLGLMHTLGSTRLGYPFREAAREAFHRVLGVDYDQTVKQIPAAFRALKRVAAGRVVWKPDAISLADSFEIQDLECTGRRMTGATVLKHLSSMVATSIADTIDLSTIRQLVEKNPDRVVLALTHADLVPFCAGLSESHLSPVADLLFQRRDRLMSQQLLTNNILVTLNPYEEHGPDDEPPVVIEGLKPQAGRMLWDSIQAYLRRQKRAPAIQAVGTRLVGTIPVQVAETRKGWAMSNLARLPAAAVIAALGGLFFGFEDMHPSSVVLAMLGFGVAAWLCLMLTDYLLATLSNRPRGKRAEATSSPRQAEPARAPTPQGGTPEPNPTPQEVVDATRTRIDAINGLADRSPVASVKR